MFECVYVRRVLQIFIYCSGISESQEYNSICVCVRAEWFVCVCVRVCVYRKVSEKQQQQQEQEFISVKYVDMKRWNF